MTDLTISPPPGQTLAAGHDYGNGAPSGGTVHMSFGSGFCEGPGNYYGNVIVATTAHLDQVTMDPSGNVTAFAATVRCGVKSGAVITATWAFNVTSTTPHKGYYLVQNDGAVVGFGNDSYLEYLGRYVANFKEQIVSMAVTPDGAGYWLVGDAGGVYTFGDASFFGGMLGVPLNRPIVGFAATSDGKGYWLVASDGGILSFGDASFQGSMGGTHLNQPIVGITASPGGGYWMVASDGGIFSFGVPYFGSMGAVRLNMPVVGMAATPGGDGYWLVASDGGVFTFGAATFHGSTGSIQLTQPVVGLLPGSDGNGYWLAASDGGVFAFNEPFAGSLGGQGLAGISAIAS